MVISSINFESAILYEPTLILFNEDKYPTVPSFLAISTPKTLIYVPLEHVTWNEIIDDLNLIT